jgi:hypothetical protein
MRIKFGSMLSVLLGILTFAVPALAQFRPPTDEELKMTSEPKAPGAAAIYLYREEKVDDSLHYHSLFVRIKVLTEKGKELATVSVPYVRNSFKITDVRARTIHADGKAIPLDVKPTDLMEAKTSGFQLNKVVFTLPDVQVGSILEYSWQLRYDDNTLSSPNWEIQQPYYVRKAHYLFIRPQQYIQVTNSRGDSANRMLDQLQSPQWTEGQPGCYRQIHPGRKRRAALAG